MREKISSFYASPTKNYTVLYAPIICKQNLLTNYLTSTAMTYTQLPAGKQVVGWMKFTKHEHLK